MICLLVFLGEKMYIYLIVSFGYQIVSGGWVQLFCKYLLLFLVQCLPRGIINYLPREGFTKDYTKASILTVKL